MAKKVTVTWTDPSPTTNVDHLEIWRKTGVGGTYAQIGGDISLAAANTYEDTNGGAGLTDSTTYYYQVRAYAADGTTYESIEANITISAVTIAAPTTLAIGTPTATTIPLTWVASGSAGVTHYRIYLNGVLNNTFAAPATSGNVIGLTASTPYTNITVRAWNGTTESANSNAVSATTASAAEVYGVDFSQSNTYAVKIPKVMSRSFDLSIKMGSGNLATPTATQYLFGHGGNGDGLTHFALKMSATDATKMFLRYNGTNTTETVVVAGTVIRVLVENDGISLFKDGTLVQKITADTTTLSTSEAGCAICTYNYTSPAFYADVKIQSFKINTEDFPMEEGSGNTITGTLGTVGVPSAGVFTWYTI